MIFPQILTVTQLQQKGILKDISSIPDSEPKIKTKLRNTCEKHSEVQVPYSHRKIHLDLSKNKKIVILKQGKSRGVVMMDKHKHVEKCMSLLTTKYFK